MRKTEIAVVALLCIALAGCPCQPTDTESLAVPLHAQETSMWCWASSGQMVMNYLGGSVVQCDEADKEFGKTDCCNSPTPGGCVQGGWPQPDKYGFTADTTADTALTWDQVRDQIFCKKKPFAFSWHWPGGGGHMMVAMGYTMIGGVNYVEVNNPWPPNVGDHYTHTYDDYVSGSDHTHWNDYYNFTKK
jgi:Papain-like cysteine protease AvrRpt2